jgi:hypothetical protein
MKGDMQGQGKGLWIRAALLAVCALVASCATNERERIQSILSSSTKEATACYAHVAAIPEYAPIYAKIHVAPTPAPEAMLRDEEHYSADMLALGLSWYAVKQACDQQVFRDFSRVSPDLAALGVGWANESARIVQDAVTNLPSYGALNREIAALAARERSEMKQWIITTKARLDQQQAAQEQAMQVTGQVLQFALAALVARQNALADMQRNYTVVNVNNTYIVPVRVIVPTRCRYTGTVRPLAC